LNIYYHSLYTDGIDPSSTFPRERYRLIKNELKSYQSNGFINIAQSKKAKIDDIYRAHLKDYVDRFIGGQLSDKETREIGLKPWTQDIVKRTLLITGGSLQALEDIYKGANIAANMAGGTHHAFEAKGSGFCIFNDLAICALKAIDHFLYKKILIIDLDVHQGDGTASILKGRNEIFTFSMHCEKNYPFKKENSNYDVSLNEGLNDNQYLKILEESLLQIDSIKSDIIFFQAGVDTLSDDRYGKLNLTREGLKKRNEYIFHFSKNRKNPILIFMGGGYSKPINSTVLAFKDLFTSSFQYRF